MNVPPHKPARAWLAPVCALLFLVLAFAALGGGQNGFQSPALSPATDSKTAVELTQDGLDHILYGDARGGGHLHGTGKPCKTEFPAHWDTGKIAQAARTAANDNTLDWTQGDNGYWRAEKWVEGVKLRIVVDRDDHDIVTAYPVNLARNPCPAR